MTAYDCDGFYRRRLSEERERVYAACRALGALEYHVDPASSRDPKTRLVKIRAVVAELRADLGLPPEDGLTTDGGEPK